MHYKFPVIEDISQVREAIKDCPDFFEAEREYGFVFNYYYNTSSTFPPVTDERTAILRELRGLKFDHDGKVLSRPFHKFFNLGEKLEVFEENIDWSQPHVYMEKRDGSFVTPWVKPDRSVKMMTKMGLTDVSVQVDRFIEAMPIHESEMFLGSCRYVAKMEATPIMEYTAPTNRIVLKYDKPELVLLAIRDNVSGDYYKKDFCSVIATMMGIKFVSHFTSQHLPKMKDLTGIEGYVVAFDNGMRLKMKTQDYILKHRAKDNILNEKAVLALIIDDQIDDILSLLSPKAAKIVSAYQDDVLKGINYKALVYAAAFTNDRHLSRKEFALQQHMQPLYQKACFACWEIPNESLLTEMKKFLSKFVYKNTSTQAKVDAIRYIWGGHRYDLNQVSE